jgi:hypothetical protein
VFQVGAMLTESRPVRVALELAEHPCFGDRVVGLALEQRRDPTFQHVDAVACNQQEPMRRPPFAECVGVPSNDP